MRNACDGYACMQTQDVNDDEQLDIGEVTALVEHLVSEERQNQHLRWAVIFLAAFTCILLAGGSESWEDTHVISLHQVEKCLGAEPMLCAVCMRARACTTWCHAVMHRVRSRHCMAFARPC